MATVDHYKGNLRDILFNLFEAFKIQDSLLGHSPFAAIDEETATDSLRTFESFVHNTAAKYFVEGDTIPLRMNENNDVLLPPGMKKSIEAFYQDQWHLFDMPERLGGMGAPRTLYWATFEMMVGANPPIALYLFGTSAASLIDKVGTAEQKSRYIRNILDKHWGATMVLTEADAGSDVGAGRTKARKLPNGEWEIEGVKRFITNGDFDAVDNILHLVLARPEGAPSGTKGLSLFLIPKYWVNEDGSVGERNGVICSNLEHKMGIQGSATCELTFGEKKPARALLLGDVHEGIKQMFMVIEQARMAVGVKSMSTLSTAYLNALEFTKERTQGPDLAQALDRNAPKVAIIQHPDVKRMLMMQKSHAEGMRALCYYAAVVQDQAILEGASAEEREKAEKLRDILLPLVKGYNSDRAFELLALSLQCYGGSGYLKDYPIEQYIRDQKIDSLYEGTTHIQSLDLIFRKIAKDGGETFNAMLQRVKDTLEQASCKKELGNEYELLNSALLAMEGIYLAMLNKLPESFYYAGLYGNRLLQSFAELIIGWLLIQHAEIATQKFSTASDNDRNFYEGKIASARFFAANILPNVAFNKSIIDKANLDLMQVPVEAF